MKFGIAGLGRMGASLSTQAMEKGHHVVGYDASDQAMPELAGAGLEPSVSVIELVSKLDPPRIVFLYVPHGDATEELCRELRPLLARGDIVADGGNSHWEDSKRRHAFLAETGVRFLDVGTSGGIEGARRGACFMVGGDEDAYETISPLLVDLAVDEKGVLFTGAPGSGHFTKLVHNAIEFGMVQAIAEGVELLERSEFDLSLAELFENWQHGSVIRSWLVGLMGNALQETADLAELSRYVEDTGEVKWIVDWALRNDIPTPVISESQQALMQYRDLDWPQAKAVALLRNQYGGHPVHRIKDRRRDP